MKRAYSLRREDFQRVWDNGRSWSHPLIILRARSNEAEASRFAFVAGKKTGNAVRRNRAKRLLRESVRRRLETIAPGWDIILISRPGADGSEWTEVDAAVASVLRRAHLVHGS
jgi:ribonuclease P protein component